MCNVKKKINAKFAMSKLGIKEYNAKIAKIGGTANALKSVRRYLKC